MEVWTARDLGNGQSSITDENGLFVAQAVTQDAAMIVEAPRMEAVLRKFHTGEPFTKEIGREITELLQRIDEATSS
jgi:hypothetical protein